MLEVIATCASDVEKIVAGGGERIELVSSLSEGGLTPSRALIEYAVTVAGKIPVMVMIRPHAMSFVYSAADLSIMEKDIDTAFTCGAHGVVFGALTEQGVVDEKAIARLLPHAQGKSVTFHRAIDQSNNPLASLRTILSYPFDRVLTSGGSGKIMENVTVLKEMMDIGRGKITVLAGGGVTIKNVSALINETGVAEIHVGTAVRDGFDPLNPILPNLIEDILKQIQHG